MTLDLARLFDINDMDAAKIIKQSNEARNRMKHLDNHVLAGVLLDDKREAEEMLSRAIENYRLAFGELTAPMARFDELVKGEL